MRRCSFQDFQMQFSFDEMWWFESDMYFLLFCLFTWCVRSLSTATHPYTHTHSLSLLVIKSSHPRGAYPWQHLPKPLSATLSSTNALAYIWAIRARLLATFLGPAPLSRPLITSSVRRFASLGSARAGEERWKITESKVTRRWRSKGFRFH